MYWVFRVGQELLSAENARLVWNTTILLQIRKQSLWRLIKRHS